MQTGILFAMIISSQCSFSIRVVWRRGLLESWIHRPLPHNLSPVKIPNCTFFSTAKNRQLTNSRPLAQTINTMSMDEFGDDDELFASLDVDQLVDQHYKQNQEISITPNAHSLSTGNSGRKNDENLTIHPNQKSPATKRQTNDTNAAIKSESPKKAKLSSSDFKDTLLEFFGYEDFRPGQLEVIEQLMVHKRDSAVFWATGKGKSLNYQIPALMSHQTNDFTQKKEHVVIVVSPLISLMQDQVHKINNLSDRTLSNYLGSGQTDKSVESKALGGEYCLLYITPEKLSSGTFLSQLRDMHKNIKPVALFAIDEAHCVSEWGHDFRPEFRNIGRVLRGEDAGDLAHVPILSLTATAIPMVQDDIIKNLGMKDPFKSLGSFDRSNLEIKVSRKPSGGVQKALSSLIKAFQNSKRKDHESTIVYAPTRNNVESAMEVLRRALPEVKVEAYHAGMSAQVRNDVHTNFLTGETHIIVATIAFGMGIDKIDTRRIFHLGPPKTMEEYYQQIGRAGRDGLPAYCEMVMNEADFSKYNSDFYLGSLEGKALEATKASMKSLREFAMSTSCRRATILRYFEQKPSFGEECGTCDNCLNKRKYQADLERDFSEIGARLVLVAIMGLKAPSMSKLTRALTGKTLKDWEYNIDKNFFNQRIDQLSSSVPKHFPKNDYFKTLVQLLVQKGLVTETLETPKSGASRFAKPFLVYRVSSQGRLHADNLEKKIILPVPECVRVAEEKQKAKRKETLAILKEAGVNTSDVPDEELAEGDGPVVHAFRVWQSYLQRQKNNISEDRLQQLEELVSLIESWRSQMAIQNRLAPVSVMAEHVLVSIAYAQATLPPGRKLDRNSLVSTGVRGREIESLVAILGGWVDRYQPASSDNTQENDKAMVFPTGGVQGTKWQYAVYKPTKKTGKARWEETYDRFAAGESVSSIAITGGLGGKPVQAKTIVGHLLEALVQGKNVDGLKLIETIPAPTEAEWQKLEMVEDQMKGTMDPVGDPSAAGVDDGNNFGKKDFLRPILRDLVDTKASDRTDEEQRVVARWYDCLGWFLTFRRIDFEPSFSN